MRHWAGPPRRAQARCVKEWGESQADRCGRSRTSHLSMQWRASAYGAHPLQAALPHTVYTTRAVFTYLCMHQSTQAGTLMSDKTPPAITVLGTGQLYVTPSGSSGMIDTVYLGDTGSTFADPGATVRGAHAVCCPFSFLARKLGTRAP